MVQGHITTQYESIDIEKIRDDDSLTFESLKHSLARDNSLLHYLEKVIDEFQIPRSYANGHSDESPTTCVAGELFRGLPTNRCMEKHELEIYHQRISERKGKKRVLTYVNEPFAKKLRLNENYKHDNLKQYHEKGQKCILCGVLWKGKKRSTTTKGCSICEVPLCSAEDGSKFHRKEDSCWYIWHYEEHFPTAAPEKKPKKSSPGTSAPSSSSTRRKRQR